MRVRASFEPAAAPCDSQSVWADLEARRGEPVSWRDLRAPPSDLETPVVVSKVVRHHGRGPRRGQRPGR